MTRILSNEDMEKILVMKELVPVLEDAFKELVEGRGGNRLRSDIVTPTNYAKDALYALKSMDGVIPKFEIGAIRLNSDILSWPQDAGGGMRRVKVPAAPGKRYTGLALIFSTLTGEPLIICPDGYMQHMRVGATSALAAKYMARVDSTVAAIIGSGFQATARLEGLDAVFDLKDIRVFSPRAESRGDFAARMSEKLGKEVRPCESGEEACAGAHIVHCATNAVQPVFFREWLEPGMHVGIIRPAATKVERSAWPDFELIALLDHEDFPIMVYTHGVGVGEDVAGTCMGMEHDAFHASMPTLPAIMTGRHPSRVGARNNGKARARGLNKSKAGDKPASDEEAEMIEQTSVVKLRLLAAGACVAAAATVVGPAWADAVADFYDGKTVTVSVGFGAGGGYDHIARLVARHMGKHIPGNPTVIVQNRPGGGGVKCANWVYALRRATAHNLP